MNKKIITNNIVNYFLEKGATVSKDVNNLVFSELKEQKEEIIKEIEDLIAEEMLICHKEGQPTSRLTSLVNKINHL